MARLPAIMLGMVGNAIVWGMTGFLQFRAKLPLPGGFGLSELEIGILIGISTLFTTGSNLFWGAASDRTRTRWGKRKPFMIVFPPLVTLALWLSARANTLFAPGVIFYGLMGTWTAKNVLHAAANIPYSVTIPEIVPPEGRFGVSQFSAFVNGVGFALGALVPTLLFSAFDDFSVPFLVAGVIMTGLYIVSCLAIPDRQYPVDAGSMHEAMKLAFKDVNFLKFQVAQLFWTLGLNIVMFMLPFMAQDVLGFVEESQFGWLFLSFLVIGGGFLLAVNLATTRWNVPKKKALTFSLVFLACILPFFGLVGSDIMSAAMPPLAQVYVFGTLAFLGLIGIFIFPYAIMMALFDYTRGTEATYNGINSLFLGFAAIPAAPLGGVLLVFGGYWLAGVACAVLMVIAVVTFARVDVPEHLFQAGSREGA